MRHFTSASAPSSSRLTAVVGACLVSLCATTAVAAEPTSSTTEVTTPAGTPVVVVTNTTVPASAPAPAPAVAVAPAADPTWTVPVQPAPNHIAVDLHPYPMAPPTIEQQIYSRKLADVSRARSLRVAGWATLGGSYAFSALIGTIAIDTGNRRMHNYGVWMTVPVVGPLAATFQTRSATGGLFTAMLGATQVAGLAMAIVGGARHRRFKRELQLTAMPTQGGGHVGMSMRF